MLDERAPAAAEVCTDRYDNQSFQCRQSLTDEDGAWNVKLPIVENVEQASQRLRLTPIDKAGNRSAAQQFDYLIDIVAPAITASLNLPSSIQSIPIALADTILIHMTGTYDDQVGVAGIALRMERPDRLVCMHRRN